MDRHALEVERADWKLAAEAAYAVMDWRAFVDAWVEIDRLDAELKEVARQRAA